MPASLQNPVKARILRHVVLGMETNGLRAGNGHRIAEIAAIELVDRRTTGRYFHKNVNPERAMDSGFVAIHGLSLALLQDQPRFSELASTFIEFMDGATLVAHNAPFYLAFINGELALIDRKPLESRCFAIVDSLLIARKLRDVEVLPMAGEVAQLAADIPDADEDQ